MQERGVGYVVAGRNKDGPAAPAGDPCDEPAAQPAGRRLFRCVAACLPRVVRRLLRLPPPPQDL